MKLVRIQRNGGADLVFQGGLLATAGPVSPLGAPGGWWTAALYKTREGRFVLAGNYGRPGSGQRLRVAMAFAALSDLWAYCMETPHAMALLVTELLRKAGARDAEARHMARLALENAPA